MTKKHWAVKNNFFDLIEHIKNLGNVDLNKHFQSMNKNAAYVSRFTVDEFVKMCSDWLTVFKHGFHLAVTFFLMETYLALEYENFFIFSASYRSRSKEYRLFLYRK